MAIETASHGARFFWSRGFVVQVECDSAFWLACGDALSWSPKMTTCAICGDRNVSPGYCSHTDVRFPRPCPATAQPITTVRLTTEPSRSVLADRLVGSIPHEFREGRLHDLAYELDNQPVIAALRLLWPAVRLWHLPPVEVAVNDELLEEVRAAMRDRGRV